MLIVCDKCGYIADAIDLDSRASNYCDVCDNALDIDNKLDICRYCGHLTDDNSGVCTKCYIRYECRTDMGD